MKVLISLFIGSIVLLHASNDTPEDAVVDVKKANTTPDMSKFVSRALKRAPKRTKVDCKRTALIFPSEQKTYTITRRFRPLPVTLKVVDKEGTTILESVLEKPYENNTTYFEIPVNILKDDTKLKVFNARNELIFCNTVKFDTLDYTE